MTFTESAGNTQIHKHTITVFSQYDRADISHIDKVGIAPCLSAIYLIFIK
jgi:hypothetical protein